MGWRKVKLKEVLKQYRVQHIVQDDVDYKQVTISKYDGVIFRGSKIGKEIGRKRQFVIDLKKYPDTLMLVRQGVQEGSIGLAPFEVDGCIATENMPMFSVEGIDVEYLKLILKSPYFYDELNKIQTTGSAQKSIHEREILEIEIPLPSFEEQSVFVKEVTKLKGKWAEIGKELTNQLSLIKQLRQAFLLEAMQGKLFPSELVEEQEAGQQLLAHIKAEKAQLIKDKKLKKEKELPPIKPEEIPFEIPKDWVWCRLGEICSKIGSGSTPKGSNYSQDGKPFFRSQNIHDNGLVFSDIKYVSEVVQKQMAGTVVLSDDLLLNITGGSLGRCALVPNDFEEGNVSQHVCIIRSLQVDKVFMHKLVLSPYFQKLIFSSTTGAGREGLPKYNLEQFIIPLPPLSIQNQIVEKLDGLMKTCDDLENSIKQSQTQNEQLLQQVLKEALEVREQEFC